VLKRLAPRKRRCGMLSNVGSFGGCGGVPNGNRMPWLARRSVPLVARLTRWGEEPIRGAAGMAGLACVAVDDELGGALSDNNARGHGVGRGDRGHD
jgi:hypothetical protein